jgi:hypothetical protein
MLLTLQQYLTNIYHREERPVLDVQVLSFQEAVKQSKHMSDEQKGVWHTILVYEGLS